MELSGKGVLHVWSQVNDVLCMHTLYLLAYVAECGMQQVP